LAFGTKSGNVTRDYPTTDRVTMAESGSPTEKAFLCFQLRSPDPGRFAGPPGGKVSGAMLERIETAARHFPGL